MADTKHLPDIVVGNQDTDILVRQVLDYLLDFPDRNGVDPCEWFIQQVCKRRSRKAWAFSVRVALRWTRCQQITSRALWELIVWNLSDVLKLFCRVF